MHSPPPIRAKLLRILLVPLISMVVLWGFIAFSNAEELVGANRFEDRWLVTGAPALQVIEELQNERRLAAEAAGGTSERLDAQRTATDKAVEQLRQAVGKQNVTEDAAAMAERMREVVRSLDGLRQLRESADEGRLASPAGLVDAYSRLIDVANRRLGNRDPGSGLAAVTEIRGATAYSDAGEYLQREYALLAAGNKLGKTTATDRAAFIAAFTARRIAFDAALRDSGPGLRPKVESLAKSEAYKRVVQVEDRLYGRNPGGKPPVDIAQWKSDVESLVEAIGREARAELTRVTAEQEVLRARAAVSASLILLLGAGAVALSIFLSYRFGNSMIAEFRRLQAAAAQMARERLPRIVERLRKGEDVDVEEEAPPLPAADTAEFDEVIKSFSAVQRTAVEAAVGQATLRKGIAQVFLNLAWRNQVLLQRQLSLLDTMERRVEEPDILEDLFKLDHLTTRMRRHAENLIILSEAAPARRWRDPVPIYDLVRSAVLEVEDYTRVTVSPMPQAPMLLGSAVTDVIHLISELVENATVFSPPDTTVHVRSTRAANGFALEIEDRGLGLNQTMLDEFNARLADPPEFDLADSDRLGLFVVARLAARHNIKIVLRPSPYDGTTAIVMLPTSLLVTPDMPDLGPEGFQQADQGRDLRVNRPMRALSTVSNARPTAEFSLTPESSRSEPSAGVGTATGTRMPPTGPVSGTPLGSPGMPGRSSGPGGWAPGGSGATPGAVNGLREDGSPGTGSSSNGSHPGGSYLGGSYSADSDTIIGGTPIPPAPQAPSGPSAATDSSTGPVSGPSSRLSSGSPSGGAFGASPGGAFGGPSGPASGAFGTLPGSGPGAPAARPGAPGGSSAGRSDSEYSSPWFAPERIDVPRSAFPPYSAPAPPTRAAGPGPDLSDDDDDDLDGLPRRVPQASMAPQLRRQSDDREVSSRSPEELMDMMASMQRGWQEGRSLVEQGRGQTEQERGRPEQGNDAWNRKDGDSDVRPQN
ncbi:nitrate- and nitrite sensing domain-containing protein [Thermopolyspora sp. NPDC052614]|uniref:sensor histidine kinase n=1 Tax=Thermopolyspora sp. NPDC052614 TaxID=3155682 RepID=UPI00342327E9